MCVRAEFETGVVQNRTVPVFVTFPIVLILVAIVRLMQLDCRQAPAGDMSFGGY